MPSPAPWCAPSIRPGMSSTTSVSVGHNRRERQRDQGILALRAVPVGALSVFPAPGPEDGLVAEVIQRVERGVGDRPDRAAVTPVASGRTPARHELLAAEGHATV